MLGMSRGTISVALLVMFAVLAGCCMLLPTVNAQVFALTLDSRMDHAPFLHSQGTITLDVSTYTLPHTGSFGTRTYSITYNPDLGFVFRYWYVESGSSPFCYFSDPNSQSTTLTTPQVGVCSVGAVYDYSSYSVVFQESGIPSGVSWGVTVGGTPYTSTSSSVTVSGLTGTVSYTFDSAVDGFACGSGCSGSVTGAGTVYVSYSASFPVSPVGGCVTPVNKVAILAPYVTLFGLIVAVAVVIVRPWNRPEQ
jgi:hypothetical protein